jgi:hypothetical protein
MRIAIRLASISAIFACGGSGGSTPVVATQHNLLVTAIGAGVVTSSPPGINCPTQCTASFAVSTVVTLTATPQGSGTFSGWTGGCTGSAACSVTMGANASVAAAFSTPVGSHILTVNVSGAGSVTSTPAGIDCPASACAGAFPGGSPVTLTAAPGVGQNFQGWTGACSGTSSCTVTLSADATTTAQFSAPPGY